MVCGFTPTYLEMVVELRVDEEVVDDGRVDDLELRAQRDHDGRLHQQGEGREGNRRVTGLRLWREMQTCS